MKNLLAKILFLAVLFVLPSVLFAKGKSSLLKVSFLDIGQGDAIYIEAPNGRQMIIDGGPGSLLEGALGAVMPWNDRSIDVIMVTNPDTDHYSGFIDLLRDFDVGAIVEPGTHSKTATYQVFENAVEEEKSPHVLAHKGTRITLDQTRGIYFDVLFPNQDVSKWTSNDGSIVGKLIYGDTSIMFMGDATKKTENIVRSDFPVALLQSSVLKVGHHGSKTSSGSEWLSAIAPKEAIISVACKNSYGLPAPITLTTLSTLHIPYETTCEKGTITVYSDGKTFSHK